MKASLARVMESTMNLRIFSHNFLDIWIKDNLIANIENSDVITTTLMLKQIMGDIYVKNDCKTIFFYFHYFLCYYYFIFIFVGGDGLPVCYIIIINELVTWYIGWLKKKNTVTQFQLIHAYTLYTIHAFTKRTSI